MRIGDAIRTWTIILAVGVSLATLVGCASPLDGPERIWLDGNPESWQAGRTGSIHSRRTLLSQEREASEAAVPEGPATPEAFVTIALARNPSIRAAQRRVERLGYVVPQVTALDDPMFEIAPVGEMAQTAAGEVEVMTGVSQRLPFPGKLETRGNIAQQDVAMAVADLQQRRLEVINNTRRAYWNYYFTTQAVDTTARSRELLSQLRQIADAEYRAGTRPQQDVLRASVELGNVDNELITLEQQRASARAMLNQLMDRPAGAPLPEPAAATLGAVNLELERLLAQAAAYNPALRKAYDRIEQQRQRKRLASLQRWPDFTVSANYGAVDDGGLSMAANGDDQWWLGVGFNLPIWFEKYEAAEREAVRGVLQSVSELSAEQNAIAFRVQDALLTVEAQQRIARLFRDTVIPQARQTVQVSQSGYRAGTVDFLTVVDNWRNLLSYELMYHRAVANLEQAFADLERAVGRDLPRPSEPVEPPTDTTPNEKSQPTAEE